MSATATASPMTSSPMISLHPAAPMISLSQKSSPMSTPPASDKLWGVSKQMEGLFYGMVLKEMRKTIPPDPMAGDDDEQDEFQDMMDQQVSQEMAMQSGMSGIGAQLYRQLSGGKAYQSQKIQKSANSGSDTGEGKLDIVR